MDNKKIGYGVSEQAKLLFSEIEEHLLKDNKPSHYLNEKFNENYSYNHPFDIFYRLKQTKQSPKYHPEGDVLRHTLLVVDEAAKVKAKSSDERAFMWAALLHDIGKADTTRIKKGKITSYNHDKVGAELAFDFLKNFTENFDFINKVATIVRLHMQILYVVKDMPFADINSLKQAKEINDIALFCLCDRLGRDNADRNTEEKNIKTFLHKLRDKI